MIVRSNTLAGVIILVASALSPTRSAAEYPHGVIDPVEAVTPARSSVKYYDFDLLQEKYNVSLQGSHNLPPDGGDSRENYLLPPLIAVPGWSDAVREAVNERRRQMADRLTGGDYLYSLSFFDFYDYASPDPEKILNNGVLYYHIIEPGVRSSIAEVPVCGPVIFFSQQFRAASGRDIDRIRMTASRRGLIRHEREALMEYNAFAMVMAEEIYTMLEEEKRSSRKLVDYAIMANDVYDPLTDTLKVIRETDWRPVTQISSVKCPHLSRLLTDLRDMNKGWSNMGFYARVYRHESNGEYVVAFSGTNLKSSAVGDILTNVAQLKGTPRQYRNAREVGLLLRDSAEKITFVGHSLGGGLATVAGLITGFDTYIYNPADLSEATVNTIKEDICAHPSIKAYATTSDPVTSIQHKFVPEGETAASSLSKRKAVLYPVDKEEIYYVAADPETPAVPESSVGRVAQSIGKVSTKIGGMLSAHSMQTIEDHFKNIYSRRLREMNTLGAELDEAVKAGTLFASLPR